MRSTAYRAALLTAIAARATQTAAAAQDFGWMTAEMRSEGSAGERPSRLRSFLWMIFISKRGGSPWMCCVECCAAARAAAGMLGAEEVPSAACKGAIAKAGCKNSETLGSRVSE